MNRIISTFTVLTAAAFVLAAAPARGQQPTSATNRRQPAAVTNAQPPTKVTTTGQRRPAQSNVKTTSAEGPQGFSIVLVLGEMQASGAQSDVPPAAQKALADMKDFLPYKGYRLLDAQWTLCCGRTPLTTLLRGPDEREYALELSATPVPGDGVNVRFELADTASATRTQEANWVALTEKAQVQIQELRARRAEAVKSLGPRHPDVQALDEMISRRQREVETARRGTIRNGVAVKGSPRRRLIDTSFRMDIGETVVVGTSRVQGDKALIALLTAVPQRKSEAR